MPGMSPASMSRGNYIVQMSDKKWRIHVMRVVRTSRNLFSSTFLISMTDRSTGKREEREMK